MWIGFTHWHPIGTTTKCCNKDGPMVSCYVVECIADLVSLTYSHVGGFQYHVCQLTHHPTRHMQWWTLFPYEKWIVDTLNYSISMIWWDFDGVQVAYLGSLPCKLWTKLLKTMMCTRVMLSRKAKHTFKGNIVQKRCMIAPCTW